MSAPGLPAGQTGTVTSRVFDLARIGAGLSFAAALDDVGRALDTSTALVISAPPGTGKTTLVPPLLSTRTGGRVIVTQPRRVAARAAARRLAEAFAANTGQLERLIEWQRGEPCPAAGD